MSSRLSASDRRTAERVAAQAVEAGPDAVERAIAIHRGHLTSMYAEQDRLTRELADVERAIAMRECALVVLRSAQS